MDTVPTTSAVAPDSEQPKKLIRTFEGDRDILKKGGTPDLAPFHKPEPAASERLIESSALPPIPIRVPAPLHQPITEPFPVAVSNAVKEEVLKTYASDFTKRMEETHASTATVLAAEQDAGGLPGVATLQKFSRSGVAYSIVGGILLIVGAIGVYIAYT
ncbi:MAG: hypothetical protein WA058_03325, partial [Minisyncoccia bacterium]